MARPRKSRARQKRRNAERTARNLAAKQASVQQDKPKLEYARQKQYLEVLRDRGRKFSEREDQKPSDVEQGITDRQYEAGNRLYRDWRTSGGEPRLVPGYGGFMARSVNAGYAEFQVAARFRFERVLGALNMLHRTVVIHCCLLDLPLAGWCVMVPSKGIVCLREALDLVAEAYDRPPKREYIDTAIREVVESW